MLAWSDRRVRLAVRTVIHASRGDGGRGLVTLTSDPGLQFPVVDAFGDLAESRALSAPVVVGADDLQCADLSW